MLGRLRSATFLTTARRRRSVGAVVAVVAVGLTVMAVSAGATSHSPVLNPAYPGTCANANIVLVLDESGSISNHGGGVNSTQQMRDGATLFVNSLDGTAAKLKIVEFSDNAAVGVPFTSVTGHLSDFTGYLNPGSGNHYGDGSTGTYTNWEAALQEAQKTDSGVKPDLVVFFTDGDPNRTIAHTFANSSVTEAQAAAVVQADSLKGQGIRIYGVGVGGITSPSDSETRLSGVTGPVKGPNILTQDYNIATFNDLGAIFKDLCAPKLNVTKSVVGSGASPSSFDIKVDGAVTDDTKAGGTNVEYNPGIGGYSTSETPVTGYTTTFSPGCSGTIGNGEVKSCTVTNTRDTGSLKLSKSLTGGPDGGAGSFTIHYDCGAGHTGDASVSVNGSQTIDRIPTGTQCTVSETPPTPPAGYTFGTPTFTDNSGTSNDGIVTITKDPTVEVTTNNTLTLTLTERSVVIASTIDAPTIDVLVVKDATAAVRLGSDGKATITYSVLVKNNGPNTATNVTLLDSNPSGVTFVAITKNPDFGSCAPITASLLSCNLGNMGPGVQTLITFTATVNKVGTIVNSATAIGGGGGETNPNNNTASATTVVTAAPPVLTPPVTKSKPKPLPEICNTIAVAQKVVKASGKKQTIRTIVTQGGKKVAGARVTLVGPGIKLTVKTNRAGVALATVTPSKPGIIRVSITNKKACNTQRIGVIGVFEPPVTG